jgi:hypothetical protein
MGGFPCLVTFVLVVSADDVILPNAKVVEAEDANID